MDFSKIDLQENQILAREIVLRTVGKDFKKRRDFEKFRNSIIKEHGGRIFHNLYFIKAYNDLIAEGLISSEANILKYIQKRGVRTMSGVAPVTVMTKPFPCPGRCVYCPTDVRMPKSYLPSQPAAQRAFRQRFNPYTQVFVRLKAMGMTGHEVSKVELRVIGGTWSSYEKSYQEWFIGQCLLAMNEFFIHMESGVADNIEDITHTQDVVSEYGTDVVNTVLLEPISADLTFDEIVKANETAEVRCIGINIETRPDFISEDEVKRLRCLGVTKVEMGVQTTDDEVQRITKRGHDLASVREATKLLKDAGFKIGYHMMPNLPGSTIEIDKNMIRDLFDSSDYQPDYLKIYPCMVIEKTELSTMFERGEYKSYDDETLQDILYQNLKDVPQWCRVDRIARDIPAPDIESGSKVSNVRQVLENRMKKEGVKCRDIRSREIQGAEIDAENVELVVREYDASGGKEIFLSFDELKLDKLVALLRLRLPSRTFIDELVDCAIVREVHVYGKQIAIGDHSDGNKQHVGWGTRLMKRAEELAKDAGYKKLAIIAGIGTREYYKKKGYTLIGTYMIKSLVE